VTFFKNVYQFQDQEQLSAKVGCGDVNQLLVVAEAKGSYNFNTPAGCPKIPNHLQLRQYQQQAVSNWFANQGRGTLKMATGSGKTITALAIVTELYQKIGLQFYWLFVLIAILLPNGTGNVASLAWNLF
jgi:superfamily II DNA or RNA helicase